MEGTADTLVEGWGPLDGLPGNPMMWILILGELTVFGILLIGFGVARSLDHSTFAASQLELDRLLGAVNTVALITSGWLAALALQEVRWGRSGRPHLIVAIALGVVFLVIKAFEYRELFLAGLGIETDTFFTLYFLITGFHSLHVIMGIVLLAIVSWRNSKANVEMGTAFWHMTDLVWLLVFPVIYLMR